MNKLPSLFEIVHKPDDDDAFTIRMENLSQRLYSALLHEAAPEMAEKLELLKAGVPRDEVNALIVSLFEIATDEALTQFLLRVAPRGGTKL